MIWVQEKFKRAITNSNLVISSALGFIFLLKSICHMLAFLRWKINLNEWCQDSCSLNIRKRLKSGSYIIARAWSEKACSLFLALTSASSMSLNSFLNLSTRLHFLYYKGAYESSKQDSWGSLLKSSTEVSLFTSSLRGGTG